MAAYDFTTRRLHVADDLREGSAVALDRAAANYLLSVLRLSAGTEMLVFNGRDGEWRARLEPSGRKAASLLVLRQERAQTPVPDLVLLFAPLKHARLDYVAQKAVEMGVGRLQPVITRRTVATRINLERMRANVVEAAEQCGVLAVPEVRADMPLASALQALDPGRLLVFCDEDAPVRDPVSALSDVPAPSPCALLLGPEGGFDPAERDLALRHPGVRRLSLGPRILRADTAAVAALAIVQAVLGDWRADGVRPSLQGHERGPM